MAQKNTAAAHLMSLVDSILSSTTATPSSASVVEQHPPKHHPLQRQSSTPRSTHRSTPRSTPQPQSGFYNETSIHRPPAFAGVQIDMGNPKLVDLFVNYFGIQDWQSMVLRRNRGPTANNGVDYQSLQRRQNIDWAITCLHEGTIALHKGDNSTAMKKYNAALDMDPQCVDALVARGGIFLNSGKFTSAMKDLEYALSLDPHHENAIRYLRRVRTAMSKEESDKKALLRGEFLMPANYDPRNKDVPTLKTKPEIEDKYPMLNDSESSGREGPSRPHRRRSLSDSERQSKTRRKHKHQKKKSKSSSKHSKKKSKHSKKSSRHSKNKTKKRSRSQTSDGSSQTGGSDSGSDSESSRDRSPVSRHSTRTLHQ
ncbi:hypothetical protein BASA61_004048 [Batrachochytrium salamandrivorans]|nr:hypothetical protein BASA62_003545 [Batrachochytrium salamandrivorans]KAH6594325.1 hypothetical protein BASA61_004048 [Batrachochytrium salamandrivorans]KAJ1340463.1 hypothetical protein BSLG_004910 [Batrachochytrium salamandrivorans]